VVGAQQVGGDLVVSAEVVVPASELKERFSRSSGPGGQGVNTADSRVELTLDLAGCAGVPDRLRDRALARLRPRLVAGTLTVVAAEHRSQLANRRAARQRLAQLLAEAMAPPPRARRGTRPTRGSVRRRLGAKQRRGDLKRHRRRPSDD
jgi:ribosome-associated protein